VSLLNQRWKINSVLEDSGLITDVLLEDRKISDKELFLSPQFEALHDPFLMMNMQKAIDRILLAEKKKEKVVVYGDYDIDGVTSTILIVELLEKMGLEATGKIPHRVDDGYGLNIKHIDKFKEKGVSLIITVDNGIAAFEAIKKANELNIDVVVLDHHTPQDKLPEAIILNPLQEGCNYPNKDLCGVGIAYKFLQAMGKVLPDIFDEGYIKWQIDLVAMGTVADCMKLIDENRIFVEYGLKVMSKTKRLGLKKLIEFSGISDREIESSDIGFKIGPKINAAGRLDTAMKAFDALYLKTDEPSVIENIFELQELNSKRQNVLNQMILDSYTFIDTSDKFVFARKNDWHAGVIGLLAGHMSRENSKPAFAICKTNEGIVGSIRCPEMDFNIMDVLNKCEDLLDRYGGHKSAAGFTVKEENYEAFIDKVRESFSNVTDDELEVNLFIDFEINPNQITFELLDNINRLAPFGVGNEEPVFLMKELSIDSIKLVGAKKNHIKFILKSEDNIFSAIAFNFGKYTEELRKAMDNKQLINLVFVPKVNVWKGNKSLDLHVVDISMH